MIIAEPTRPEPSARSLVPSGPPSAARPSPDWKRVVQRHGLPPGQNPEPPNGSPTILRDIRHQTSMSERVPGPQAETRRSSDPVSHSSVPHGESVPRVSLPAPISEHARGAIASPHTRLSLQASSPAVPLAAMTIQKPSKATGGSGLSDLSGPVRAADPVGSSVVTVPAAPPLRPAFVVRQGGTLRRVVIARRLPERGGSVPPEAQGGIRVSRNPPVNANPSAMLVAASGGSGAPVRALAAPAASGSSEPIGNASGAVAASSPTWRVQALAPPTETGARFALVPPAHGQPVVVVWNGAGAGRVDIALPTSLADVAPALRADAPGLLSALGQAGWAARHLTVSASRGGSSSATSSRSWGHKPTQRRAFRSRSESERRS